MSNDITFIDAGANRGQIFDWCFDRNMQVKFDNISYSQFFYKEDFRKAKFYLFEPTKRLNKYLEERKNHNKSCEINIINKAVWVEDSTVNLYLCQETKWRSDEADESIGNSIYPNQFEKMDKKNPQKIEAVDIVRWITENIQPTDYIILKLDIEGAEVEVVKHLLNSNLLNSHINELHVEWHDEPKIPGLNYTEDKRKNWTITENYFLEDLLKAKAYYKRWQL